MRIAGSHTLVTGGSQGIGVEIARELMVRGAAVTILGRNEQRLQQVSEQIGASYVQLDLADGSALGNALTRIEEVTGPVDILVNNAGIAATRQATEYGDREIERLMMVNSVAPMELSRQALLGMLSRGRGHIVNISSLAGVTAVPHLAVYGASKAALHHYTAGVQRELRLEKSSVGMTLVTLGEVAGTQMMEDARKSAVIATVSERLARTHAMPDIEPAQVARAVSDGIERNTNYVAVPRRIGPLVQWRDAPSRVLDLLLRGFSASGDSAGPIANRQAQKAADSGT